MPPGYAANGNILDYYDSVMGTWSLSSGYDSLNRLSLATQTPISGAAQSYCWTYDPFGNRTTQATATQPFTASYSGSVASCHLGSGTLLTNVWANMSTANNNQVANTSQATGGVAYDAAGDVSNDGVNKYLYDADGKICADQNLQTGVMTGYLYDADGTRIAKGTIQNMSSCDPAVNGFLKSTEDDYILGQSGEQVTEMDMTNGTMTWVHTNAWAGGKLLATYHDTNTYFTLTDWLGTKRVELGANPCVATYASLPYGDSLMPVSDGCVDATENHYTGKERDAESGNDYFGARYYASSIGRWLSPDLPFADQDPANPQSWNLYAYVRNNPINSIDNDGLLTILIPGTGWSPEGGWSGTNPLFVYGAALRGSCMENCTQILPWSGGLSWNARVAGAEMLRRMIADHSFAPGEKLNIITHSHGKNVALAAAHLGLTHPIDNLITLEGPTLRADAYKPLPGMIGNYFNVVSEADNLLGVADDIGESNIQTTGATNLYNFVYDRSLGATHGDPVWNDQIRGQWWDWFLNQQGQKQPKPKNSCTIYVTPDGDSGDC